MFGQYHLVFMLWFMARACLVFCGASLVHHNHRDSHRQAMFQICAFGIFPLWQRNTIRRRRNLIARQYHMVDCQRDSACCFCGFEWYRIMLYHHRHTFWSAMFQNRKACTISLWGKCDRSGFYYIYTKQIVKKYRKAIILLFCNMIAFFAFFSQSQHEILAKNKDFG